MICLRPYIRSVVKYSPPDNVGEGTNVFGLSVRSVHPIIRSSADVRTDLVTTIS